MTPLKLDENLHEKYRGMRKKKTMKSVLKKKKKIHDPDYFFFNRKFNIIL